jgi:antitoxin component YwqK of YwqJK toxin-antitoxin module
MLFKRIKLALFSLLGAGLLMTSCNGRYSSQIKETHPDGSTKTIEYFKEKDGARELYKVEEFYSNGVKKLEGYYAGGEKDGRWSSWYESGGVWSVVNYRQGKMDGAQTVYHNNGEKYFEGNFKAGIRKGTWKFWNEKGEMVNTIQYP